MSNVGTLFGWLGDIVGIHAFNDEVPVALRRRWNLVGFTIADDAVNEWLTVTVTPSLVSGDSSITVGDVTGIDLVAGDGANVDIQSTTGNVTVAAGTGAGDTCALTGYAVTCTGTNSFTASAPAVIVTSTTSTLITSETTLNLGTSDANTINIGDAGVAVNIDGTVLVNGAPIAGSDLDPAGTLTLAGATSTAVRIGDDSPSHRPSFSAWTDVCVFDATRIDLFATATDIGLSATTQRNKIDASGSSVRRTRLRLDQHHSRSRRRAWRLARPSTPWARWASAAPRSRSPTLTAPCSPATAPATTRSRRPWT
jgi:hypothetical protein